MEQPAPLCGKRVVLGVTGGIAAYKVVEACRRLVELGAHVTPVLSEAAERFVGEVTFSALASERARTSLYGDADPIPHTTLGRSADLVIVAPATARIIGAYAHGISSDLLSAILLATRAPVMVCPAMHTEMWEHPAVVENVATLRRRGVHVVGPDAGPLAGGDAGPGRMVEPEVIVAWAERLLRSGGSALAGCKVVVSAGGTREPIDPVRHLTNRSSGKQGHALAAEAWARGAEVTLVTTTGLAAPPGAEVVRVETAERMREAVLAAANDADVVVMAAAVADFRPSEVAPAKLKRDAAPDKLALEPTGDILAALVAAREAARALGGASAAANQVLVGFAAETHDVAAHAEAKLAAKGVDLVVANDVTEPDAGFDHDTNAVLIVGAGGTATEVALTTKRAVAAAVLDTVEERLAAGR